MDKNRQRILPIHLSWKRETANHSVRVGSDQDNWFKAKNITFPEMYIIECKDLIIVQLIHKHGRTIQSDNESRQGVENKLREDFIGAFRNEFKNLDDSAKIDASDIKKHSNVLIEEDILARIKLLKDEPEPGRVFAMKKYVYVDNIDVRKMVEDLGYLILKNVARMEFPIDDICNAVERSNKRME
jgi:hypothetical protein